MTNRLKVPPTKNALLDLKKQVRHLEEGYDLLERKREILTRLVYERLKTYRKHRKNADDIVKTAYYWISIAQMKLGSRQLRQLALGLKPAIKVKILPRSNMGIEYPSIIAESMPLQPIGILKSDASVDEARIHLMKMVQLFAELGEAEISLLRILDEQIKTKKRVNALKYNVIPQYKTTIKYIESRLEEDERNSLYQMKILKERQEKQK